MEQRKGHVSEYFSKPAQVNSNQQTEQSLLRNNGQVRAPNTNQAIQLMTVTRRPNNNQMPARNVQKATMQFNGISHQTNESRFLKSMETTGNTKNDSANQKMDTNQDESHRQLTELEKQRFLIGTIDKIMKWHRIMKDFCLYEVIGPVVSIQEGSIKLQKVILMRDKKGPVLKVVHYSSDRIDLPNFHIGQIIRCVGRMICSNTLQAVLITQATSQEISALPRLSAKCDQEIAYYQREN